MVIKQEQFDQAGNKSKSKRRNTKRDVVDLAISQMTVGRGNYKLQS